MAYDKAKIMEEAKSAIIKNKLFFIDDIIAYLPIAKSTFYDWKMEQSDELKRLLEINRTELKVGLRSKWYKSNAPALQMALMKLICSDEERKMLSMNHTDITTNGKEITGKYSDWTDEQIRAEVERIKNK